MPRRWGEALLAAARAAFAGGLQTAVLGAAGVMVCAAVPALTLLRGLRTTGVEGEPQAGGAIGVIAQQGAGVPAGEGAAGTPAPRRSAAR
ncbi:hypothetical protein [Streptomyces sp. NPDC054765]